MFLYPENWIEPELRDDKSEIFKELEGQLLQNELDNDRAAEILKDYLRQLEDISRLVIVGMYVENLSGYYNTGITTHIVGRTHNRPSHFYYRRWVLSSTLNYWTPWEHLPLDGVKTDHILPFIMRGDVYIAWPEITQLPAETDSGDNETAGPKWQLQMAWIRKTNRGWSDRYLTQGEIKHPALLGLSEEQMFTFRVLEMPDSPILIHCYGAIEKQADKPFLPEDGVPEGSALSGGESADQLILIMFNGYVFAKYNEDTVKDRYIPVSGAEVSLDIAIEAGSSTLNIHKTTKTNAQGNFSLNHNLPVRFAALVKSIQVGIISPASSGIRLKTFSLYMDEPARTKMYSAVLFKPAFALEMDGKPSSVDFDRPLTMVLINQVIFESSEDVRITPGQKAPLPEQTNMVPYASGYCESLSKASNTDAFNLPNTGNITLWNNTPGRFFVLPAFPIESSISNVLYYKDQNDSYLIRRDNSNDAQGKYLIVADGHPLAGELRRSVARDGLDSLFALANQSWSDPAPTSFNQHGPNGGLISQHSMAEKAIRFDPASPYASYNIELFFHVPFLIANYLSNNQRFPEAQQWFHRIFNPTTDDQATGNKRFWRYWPFRENSDTTPVDELLKLLAYEQASGDNNPQVQAQVQELKTQIQEWLENPFRPHAVARLRPRAYEFAVFFKYIDNLIAWADQLFRQSTTESINEATQLYILVARLLGDRPRSIPRDNQAPTLTYRSAAGKWDKFSSAWFELEANLVKPKPHGSGGSRDTGTHSLTSIGMLYFCVPGNEKLLSYWDKIENRLFNIRHCRNIEGVEQPVPPFQPAIDPGLLVRAVAAGLDISTVLSDMNAPLPYYRFNVLAQKASELCADLKALGSALLSTLEKKDAEELALLRSSQEIDMLNLVKEVKLEQIEEAKANLEALKQSELLTMVRFVQYQKLLGKTTPAMPADPSGDVEQTSTAKVSATGDSGELSGLGLLQAEQQQFEWSDVAVNYSRMAGAASTLAGIMHAIPQTKAGAVVGEIEFGGLHLGSIFDSISAFLRTFEANANHFASRVSTIGQYQRRQDEWVFQSRLALKEIGQIRKQIAAAEIRKLIAEKELANHEKQIKNAEDVAKFMHDKYTNRELYQWMVNQISGVYFQTYQLAYDLAKRTERAFRHELGVQDSSFVQFGYWDNLKKGLLAGERLQLDLKRMEVAYLDQNKREYEITKHVSLLSLNPIALLQLRKTGRCEFDIEEEAFDLDFPGHFMRRIKSVSLSVPCVTGPYIGPNCTLTLLKSSLRHSSALRDSKYQRDLSTDDPRFTDYYGSIQSVATSSGQNDSGLFEANLRDERYLPFEGAGVISTWRIELPDQFRQFDYDSIADIILHVRYTSREGGALLQTGALSNLDTLIKAAQSQGIARLYSVRHEFPAEWAKFKSAKISGAVKTAELTLTLREEHYPYWTRGFTMTKQLEAFADTKRGDIQISNKPDPADTDAKKDTLGGVFGGLRMCRLTQIQPPPPIGKFTLYLTDNSMEDLWLVFTRGKGN
ncbi:MAG: neuraminidase-like domain-containing protein [Candidatus Marsarchaeota archaeon]|nr:neuraminidase-like domain-containing protein [Candidatus Marsarchaeota archaeon]